MSNDLDEHHLQLISVLPETEYGRAFFLWIQGILDDLEQAKKSSWKICDDPLIEDFRVKLGMEIMAKRVLSKPQRIIETLQNLKKGGI